MVEIRRKAISECTQATANTQKPPVDYSEQTVWDCCVDEEPSTVTNYVEDSKCKPYPNNHCRYEYEPSAVPKH